MQPEANVGIKIGGGKLVAGVTIVNAQISGYVKAILSFQASGAVTGGTNSPFLWSYSYGVYFYYNVGYRAAATTLNVFDWALSPREAYTLTGESICTGQSRGKFPFSPTRSGILPY